MMEPKDHKEDRLEDLETPQTAIRRAFNYAAEYRDRGWSVIPVFGKIPAIPSWTPYQDRPPTLGELGIWFPDSENNIGIVTGRISGLVVIDCDSKEATSEWLERHPSTPLAVETPGGGTHFYYQHPGREVRNRIRVGGRKIDVRGDGGYVVAPDSRSPDGGEYRWTQPDIYCLDDVPTFDLSWIESMANHNNALTPREIHDARRYINCIVAESGKGGSNATFRAACILRDAGLSEAEVLAELIEWNTRGNAIPPWTLRELLHKTRSVFAKAREVQEEDKTRE